MRSNAIRKAKPTDIPQIKQIWEHCFTPDQEYLELVFGSLFPHCTTYVYEENGSILSTLTLVPLSLHAPSEPPPGTTRTAHTAYATQPLRGKYLYGVATRTEARGRKLSMQMVEIAGRESQEAGDAFLITRPATESLFPFYREQGFTIDVPRGTFTLPAEAQLAIETYFQEINTPVWPASKPISSVPAKPETILSQAAEIIFSHLAKTYPSRFEWPVEILQHMIRIGEFIPSSSLLSAPLPSFALVKPLSPLPHIHFEKAFFNFTME